MKYLLIILIAVACNTTAFDLLLGEYTYHFHDQERKGREAFTSEHPLIGIDTGKYTFIAMENSYNTFSIAILRTYQRNINSYFRGAVSAGIATGYEESPIQLKLGGVIPVVYLSLDAHPKSDSFGFTLTYAPDEFLGAGFRKRF